MDEMNFIILIFDPGHLRVTPALEKTAKDWFQMNYDTYKKYQEQFIVHVQNRWLQTSTIRNPFREYKPSKKSINYVIKQHIFPFLNVFTHFSFKTGCLERIKRHNRKKQVNIYK